MNGEIPVGFVRPRAQGAIDGQTHFGYNLRMYASSTGLLGQIALRRGVTLPTPDPPYVATDADRLPARIYQACWIVDCPEENCRDAGFVWLDTPLYMCANCFNEYVGGRWRTVKLPKEDDVKAIEDVLSHRKLPQYRNWNPDESISDLFAQNLEQGDTIPQGREPPGG